MNNQPCFFCFCSFSRLATYSAMAASMSCVIVGLYGARSPIAVRRSSKSALMRTAVGFAFFSERVGMTSMISLTTAFLQSLLTANCTRHTVNSMYDVVNPIPPVCSRWDGMKGVV